MTPIERAELREHAGRLGVGLDEPSLDRLGRFLELLGIWNRRFRLTGDRDRETLVRKHIVDSAAVLVELPRGGPILDIGSGAGFPGLVLACIRPDLPVVLLEPRRRPTSFLLEVVRRVPLPNVRVVEARAEDAARDESLAGRMLVVVSRALGLGKLLELSGPFLIGPGIVVAMQTRSLDERSAREAALGRGLELLRVRDYRLPGGESRRLLVFGRLGW